MRRALLVALALVAIVAVPAQAAKGGGRCTDRNGAVPFATAGHTGYVAYPSKAPTGIVVFFHGINHTAEDWADNHLEEEAQASRVVTVAMDYGSVDVPGSWQVLEGATASAAAAQALRSACPTARTTVAYGVSMGGNTSGLALAEHPGVFDWWFDVEGANDMPETYAEASAVAVSGNEIATAAKAGIEQETGGTPDQVPQEYVRRSNVARAADIAASGIRGVVMVHAVDDGLVPYNQSRELAALLRAQHLPVDFTTVTGTDGGEPGTVIDGYVPVEHPQPLAGHADEDSHTHVVGRLGFQRLRSFFAGPWSVADGERLH
jgi:enterochelin esterase-like enzyme